MSSVRSYRDLLIWQKGIELVAEIYQLTNQFPQHELYGLTNQIRRAAVSIPSNIAEGQSRQYANEFRQFLHIALGSLSEVDTQMVLALRLSYINEGQQKAIEQQIIELKKMTRALINKLPKN